MSTFPNDTQNDLVLTASVDWSSNTKQIIEDDAKDFEQNDLLPTVTASLNQPFFAENSRKDLDVSWGNYFAHKSPPMGQLSGSHGVGSLQRPQFNKSQLKETKQSVEKNHDQEQNMKESDQQQIKQKKKKKQLKEVDEHKEEEEERMTVGLLDDIDELENEDMVRINIEDMNKSLASINFGEFTDHYLPNRDSNSTQKSNSSTDSQKISKLIQVPKLKYIQRFCQFQIGKEHMNETESGNGEEIEAKIEEIIENYIECYCSKQNKKNMHLAAVTFKKEANICTALIMFDNECNENADEWIDKFLAFPDIAKLVDQENEPIFTQISAN